MNKPNDWTYQGKLYENPPKEMQGFVYCVTELDTGKKYIGKKFFWKPKTLPVTKSRKKKVKTIVESDWKKYYGSSKEVKEAIALKGEENYSREILRLCQTKGECSYFELYYQVTLEVLIKNEYYNKFIGCKIHSTHIKHLLEKEND